jgi:hypothetical protein
MGTGDCVLLNKLWAKLWDSSSGLYLPTVLKNGYTGGGLNIPSLDPYNVSAMLAQSLGKISGKDYSITINSGILTGLSDVTKGSFSCNDSNPSATTFQFGLNFNKLELKGGFHLEVSGIKACALETVSFFTGGPSLKSAVVDYLVNKEGLEVGAADVRVDLARTYRDGELQSSANGQVLVGSYYLNQDTINECLADSVDSNAVAFVSALKSSESKTMATQSYSSTNDYNNHKSANTLLSADNYALPTSTSNQSHANSTNGFLSAWSINKWYKEGQKDDRYYKLLTSQTTYYNNVNQSYKDNPTASSNVPGVLGIVQTSNQPVAPSGVSITHSNDVNLSMGNLPEDAMPIIDHKGDLIAYTQLMYDENNLVAEDSVNEDLGSYAFSGTYTITLNQVKLNATNSFTFDSTTGEGIIAVTSLNGSSSSVDSNITANKGSSFFNDVLNWFTKPYIKDAIQTHVFQDLGKQSTRDDLGKYLTHAINNL